MRNGPSEELDGTRGWIVKLSYRYEPVLLKGSKGGRTAEVVECTVVYQESGSERQKTERRQQEKNIQRPDMADSVGGKK